MPHTLTVKQKRTANVSSLVLVVIAFVLGGLNTFFSGVALAQVPTPQPGDGNGVPALSASGETSQRQPDWTQVDQKAAEALAASEPTMESSGETPTNQKLPRINVLDLAFRGGVLMIPITLMSVLTVIFGLERALGLRRRKIVPGQLIRGLGATLEEKRGFDPRAIYRLAQRHPSAAANVLKAMLLKIGRPLPEIEQAMRDATEREADRLYGNVRFLTLSAAVTPLLGLLGTVQGMIQAFFVTSHLPTGADRAEMLAQGIYTALVTTFAGLCVAIPASVLAHYFEGRIQKLLRELNESLLGLLPQLESFEGRLRVDPEQLSLAETTIKRDVPQPPPPPAPTRSGAVP